MKGYKLCSNLNRYNWGRESMYLHKKAPSSEKEEYSVRFVEPSRPRIHLSHDAPCLGCTIFPD